MFDANLRALPKGHKFFAEVYYCDAGSTLDQEGFCKGDVLLCEMLSDDEGGKVRDNPIIKVTTSKDNSFIVDSSETSEDLSYTWVVYSGNADLTGFLPQEGDVLEQAKKILKSLGEQYA